MSDIRTSDASYSARSATDGTDAPTQAELRHPKIGQELLYNLGLEHDRLRMDMDVSSREVAGLGVKMGNLKGELDKIDNQLAEDQPKLQRIEKVRAVLDKIEAKVSTDPHAGKRLNWCMLVYLKGGIPLGSWGVSGHWVAHYEALVLLYQVLHSRYPTIP